MKSKQEGRTGSFPRGLGRSAVATRLGAVLVLVGVLLGAPAVASGAPRRFLVAEATQPCSHCDSYVLPLSDPNDIARARELIELGPGPVLGGIVVAKTAAGADGINRDHLAPGAPAWSWHVTEFLEFAEVAIELCDGWPGFVEGDVAGWIQNTGGTICFWAYTVVAELPEPVPLASPGKLLIAGLLLLGAGLGLLRLRRRTPASGCL
ncbi:MAG: hypothetical protein ACE5FG_12340 [Myxococcota bacterium]